MLLVTVLMTLFHPTMTAQEKKLFTLEDLNFGGRNYHSLRPQNMFLTWWGDRLIFQDAETGGTISSKGTKETLFSLADLEGDGWHSAMNASYPYADRPLVLLNNGHQRVLYNFTTHRIEWSQTSEGEHNSHWNKRSKAVAYTHDHQLYVRTADNQEYQLTLDGSADIVYGEAVHRNEFGINEGIFWSADGQRLAFYRMDQTMVTDYPQVDIGHRMAEAHPDKYPMAGMSSHKVAVGIYDLTTRKTVFLDTPPADITEPNNSSAPIYFTNIAFSPDAKKLYMYELNRDQNDCRLAVYDAATGRRITELLRETSDKYVEPLHPVTFLPWNDDQFIVQSQKDGYNHLYLYDTKGQLLRQLTSGPWVVLDVLGFNQKQQTVVIASNELHPLKRNLFAVSIKTGHRTLLGNGEGVHRGVLSEGTGQKLYDKWSSPTVPNSIDLIEMNHSKPRITNLLTAPDPWADFHQPGYLSGTIKAADGKTDLYYRMVVPRELYDTLKAATPSADPVTPKPSALPLRSPLKKYPTVVYVYGGPHAHNVEASWHWYSRSWETYMAQKGYVVFILDNRGSENRGRDFEQVTFRQLGQVEMQDQMCGVDFLRSLPYVDMSRLGVHGWSYGGYMTISLMTNYPDVFSVGVAGGPVIDWKWYEVMYGERYMDAPQQNAEGYAKTSLLTKAASLKGKLQIIIGYNDPTVVPQHALSFIEACNEAGTQPDFYVYPGEGHNMMGHASVHLHERITQYFEDYLKTERTK